MTFEEWQNRPVYKTHVYTFNLAKKLLSLPAGDIATVMNHPILHFRILPAYRNEFSLSLRKQVAEMVRQDRKARKQELST